MALVSARNCPEVSERSRTGLAEVPTEPTPAAEVEGNLKARRVEGLILCGTGDVL